MRRFSALFVVLSVVVLTYLHYATASGISTLHNIYRELYYVPVIVAALVFGLRGAIVTYLFVLLAYVPYIYTGWTGIPALEFNRLIHVILQGLLGVIAGLLVDRDRRRRDQLEHERYLAGIGEAAAAVVHDFKSPLVTIQGFARRILEGKGDPAVAAGAIADSAETMQKMVRDILDFSKPADLDIGKEDIGTLVRQACDMCLTKAEKGGVDLVINISEAIGVEADPLLLKRALIDIVNNAIEASGKGQKVLISGRREGDRVIVKIEDRGKGMDEETLRNALTPFFTRKSSGTGLGLPIAKKIMDAHGGLLQVRSRLDEGTTVTITLPIRRKEH